MNLQSKMTSLKLHAFILLFRVIPRRELTRPVDPKPLLNVMAKCLKRSKARELYSKLVVSVPEPMKSSKSSVVNAELLKKKFKMDSETFDLDEDIGISSVSVTCIRCEIMFSFSLKGKNSEIIPLIFLGIVRNRPFSYSKKECESNDISVHFVEFSNVHNCDRISNATLSNLTYKIV